MPIVAAEIFVAATAATVFPAAGMLSFLARLSGRRRRHVRGSRSCSAAAAATASGPGASPAAGTQNQQQQQQPQQPQQQLQSATAAMDADREQQQQQSAAASVGSCGCGCRKEVAVAGPAAESHRGRGCSRPAELEEQQPQHRPRPREEQEQRASSGCRCGGPAEGQPRQRQRDCGCAADRRPPGQQRDGGFFFGGPAAALASRARSRLASLLPSYYLATLLILTYSFVGVTEACSSRSTPKPRPPTPTPRPNITFHMYTCPPAYEEWYCLNGATCFTVKIVDSLLYNCLCANGYIGQRCEFKDLDGSYLPSRQRVMLETASIAGAVTIAVFLAVITFISVYIHCKRKQKELRMSIGGDTVDGPGRDPELRPFCSRSHSLMIFMAKHPNNSTISPSIEQTRMPNWNFPPESSTRMSSVNENKRPSQ